MKRKRSEPLSDAEIEAIIQRFVKTELRQDEAEREIERLRLGGKRALSRLLELAAEPDESLHAVGCILLRALDDQKAVQPLRRLLRDPELTDLHKFAIMHTLDALGAPVDEATFRAAIRDPRAAALHSMRLLVEKFNDPTQVESYMTLMLEQMPPEIQIVHIADLSRLEAPQALPFFLGLLHAEEDEVVLAAIEALERFRALSIIPWLEERAQYDPSRRVRHAAENAALRLQARALPERDIPWPSPSPLPLKECLLSTIDGSGGQVAFLIRQRPDGWLQMVDFMFNDWQGIKDCFGVEMIEEDEIEFALEGFALEGVEMVSVSLARLRETLAQAHEWTLQARRRLPPLYPIWQRWLLGDDPEPPVEFPLGKIPSARQEELLADCDELLWLDEFESWFFNPDELQGFDQRYRKLARKRGAQFQSQVEELLGQGVLAIVDDERRRLIRERLHRQAWLLAQLYEGEEVWQQALVAADALEDESHLPLDEHPLLLEMMERSLENVIGGPIR